MYVYIYIYQTINKLLRKRNSTVNLHRPNPPVSGASSHLPSVTGSPPPPAARAPPTNCGAGGWRGPAPWRREAPGLRAGPAWRRGERKRQGTESQGSEFLLFIDVFLAKAPKSGSWFRVLVLVGRLLGICSVSHAEGCKYKYTRSYKVNTQKGSLGSLLGIKEHEAFSWDSIHSCHCANLIYTA